MVASVAFHCIIASCFQLGFQHEPTLENRLPHNKQARNEKSSFWRRKTNIQKSSPTDKEEKKQACPKTHVANTKENLSKTPSKHQLLFFKEAARSLGHNPSTPLLPKLPREPKKPFLKFEHPKKPQKYI